MRPAGPSRFSVREANQLQAFACLKCQGRVRKTASTHNGSVWVEDSDVLFVYDGWTLDTPRFAGRDRWRALPDAASQGWNVVLVLDENDSDAVLTKYKVQLQPEGCELVRTTSKSA